jgi:DNA-binding MarR family transcriptional regulator
MIPKPLEDTLAHTLAMTCRLLRARAHTSLEKAGIYRGQQFVLGVLWQQEGLTHSQLAAKLHVQPATISNILKRMDRAGLVERKPDAGDQRISRVYLTDAGHSAQAPVERVFSNLEEQILDGFTPEEQASFEAFLLRVQENLIEPTADAGSHT